MDRFPRSTTLAADKRWLVLLIVAVYLAAVFAASCAADRQTALRWFGVPVEGPVFVDLRSVVSGAKTLRNGGDPHKTNFYDPVYHVRANYPYLWFRTVLFLHLHECNPVALGVGVGILFYACALWFAGPLDTRGALIWGFFLCAPPTVFALALCNNDVVIFELLAVALAVRRSRTAAAAVGSYALIEVCAALKFFPFAAFCLALREKRRLAGLILLAGGAVFAVYLLSISAQIAGIRAVMPHPTAVAFGRNVYVEAPRGHAFPHVLSALALGVSVVLAGAGAFLVKPFVNMPRPKLEGLMVGSILFVATFALNNNFNYRLIFLLFTLPGLLHLLREPRFYGRFASALLAVLVVGWMFSSSGRPWLFLLKETANWTVFVGMLFLWLQCLPRFGAGPEWEKAVEAQA